jgi:probable F420-dependent oxidoreductase
VPKERRALAALGPRVLKLSAERTAGAHPYLVNPEHTRSAREVMGEGALLAPEQKVVLGTDRAAVRAAGNPVLRRYLGMANYVGNLRRLGFEDEDFAGDGSDRLFDAVIVHGGVEQVAAGLRAHLDAGADHVTLQVSARTTRSRRTASWPPRSSSEARTSRERVARRAARHQSAQESAQLIR